MLKKQDYNTTLFIFFYLNIIIFYVNIKIRFEAQEALDVQKYIKNYYLLQFFWRSILVDLTGQCCILQSQDFS